MIKSKLIRNIIATTYFCGIATTFPSTAVAAPPSVLVFDGAKYTMDYLLLAPNEYQFTLHIDESGYTGGGSFLGALAFNVGTYSSFSLLSTPDTLSNWYTHTGGLSASGCNYSGANWVCIDSIANSNKGYGILPLSEHTDDQYVFKFTGMNLSTDLGVELKAQYVDDDNKKVGSLISTGITPLPPPVPEPETYAMLLAGLGLLSFTAKRRKQSV